MQNATAHNDLLMPTMSVLRNLPVALRSVRRAPAFAAAVILTLTLGIGAGLTIFSTVHAVLFEPLPFRDPDRIIALTHTAPGVGIDRTGMSHGTYLAYRESPLLEHVALYDDRSANLIVDDRPHRVGASMITAEFFSVMGVEPQLGRWINESEDAPSAPRVAIISARLWETLFASDADIVGKSILIDGSPRTVVGVMPRTFGFPRQETDLWIPARLDHANVNAFSFNFEGVARVRDGVAEERLQTDLMSRLDQLPSRFPGAVTPAMFAQAKFALVLKSLRDFVVGDVSRLLLIVLGAGGLLLLIAIANVANLFLVRAAAREKELSLRSVLGADVASLLSWSMLESLLLSAIGGACGILVAWLATTTLAKAAPDFLPRLGELHLQWETVAVAVVVTAIAALLFGGLPLTKRNLAEPARTLSEVGRSSTIGRARRRQLDALVMVQVALAVVLAGGSALMARSLTKLSEVHPGFAAEGRLTARLVLPRATYAGDTARRVFFSNLLERLRALPGVSHASLVSRVPLGAEGNDDSALWIEGHTVDADALPPVVKFVQASDGYLESMRIPLVAGRDFTTFERMSSNNAVIVSSRLAARFWPDGNAIGKRVRTLKDGPWYEIVGVAGDVRMSNLDTRADEAVYFPLTTQDGDRNGGTNAAMNVVIHSSSAANVVAEQLRGELRQLDAMLPVFNIATMTSKVADAMHQRKVLSATLLAAAMTAMLLGAVGIYGVIAYMVSMRTREIGVRMSVGASRASIGLLVVKQGLAVSMIGVVVGVTATAWAARGLQSLLYEVSAADPFSLGVAAISLLVTATAAALIPAWRAASIAPTEALRRE